MSVLWFIIKIILFILLGIILILLGLTAVVLLAPIRYEAYFARYEEMAYDIKFRYLVGIKGIFFLQDDKKEHRISLFGKTVYDMHSSQAVQNEEECEHRELIRPSEQTEVKQEIKAEKKSDDKSGIKQSEQVLEKTIKKDSVPEVVQEKNRQKQKEEFNSFHEAEKKVQRAKKKSIRYTRDNIKESLTNPLTYRVIKAVVKGVWDLLKVILPNEWDFELIVGTGEPADTGELIAKLTMLYPLYYQHGIIRGDYENRCLKGGFLAKGKFNLFQIVIRVVKLYFQEDVNAYIHLIKK